MVASMLHAIFLAAVLIAGANEPQQTCLAYEPAEVTVTGTMKRMIFAGRPEFSNVEEGDEPLWYWILFLDKPVCVYGKDDLDEYESQINEMQLNPMLMKDMYQRHQNGLGRGVTVTGHLYHAHTAWHKTKTLIKPTQIRLAE